MLRRVKKLPLLIFNRITYVKAEINIRSLAIFLGWLIGSLYPFLLRWGDCISLCGPAAVNGTIARPRDDT